MKSHLKPWIVVGLLWLMGIKALLAAEPIHIGIHAFRPKSQVLQKWQPLKLALEKALPQYRFSIEIFTNEELEIKVAARQLDFVLSNPSHYLLMYHRYGLSAPLLSLNNRVDGKSISSFGGVIFTRSERNDITELKDLRHKSIAISSIASFGSYQMQAYELLQSGIKVPDDIRLVYLGWPQDNAVNAVLSGKADVGFVRTGLLESLARSGKLDLTRLKIINRQTLPHFPLITSTRLYPEWVFSCLPHTNKTLIRQLIAYLLTIAEDKPLVQQLGISGFDVPQDITPVEQVLRELRMPPFDVAPEFTLADVLVRYRWQVFFGFVIVGFIVLLGLRLFVVNRRLNDSQDTLQALFNSSQVGIAWSNNTGIIEYANPKFVSLFGYTLQDVPTVEDWYLSAYPDASYRHQVVGLWERHIAESLPARTPIEPMTVSVTCKNETIRDIIIHGSWAGERLMAMFTDITELRKTQETLAKQEKHLRAILETTSECVLLVTKDGILLSINSAGLRLLESKNPVDLIGKSILPMIAPESHDDFIAFNQRICAGQTETLQFEFIAMSGARRWIETKAVPFLNDESAEVVQLAFMHDITERKQAEAKLRLMAKVFECTLEGIMITDNERNLIEVNDAFSKITGYEREEVLGKNPRLLKSGHHNDDFYKAMWQAITSTGHWSGEIWNRRKDGEIYPEWITISAISNEKNDVTHYVGISTDITLLKQHEKQLEHIAHYDALTGIPNRVLLVDRMHQALAHTRREQNQLALCYLDLDGFKPINDRLGHEVGDKVLIKITERLKRNLRGSDTLARLGGDEFVILLLGINSKEECHISLERLLNAIQQPISINDQFCFVTASIGVAIYPQDSADPDTLMRHADQAMYQAKQNGKNRYYIFDPDLDTQIKINLEFQSRIEQGLKAGEFELFYQPKVRLRDGHVVGAEALIRWQHPDRGLLSPAEFLPMIENSALEIKVGEWVIDTALRQIDHWNQQGKDLEISINLEASHIQSPDFIQHLSTKLAEYSLINSGLLQIEILETAALADLGSVSEIIESLSSIGVGFALDDFGTGYSSLSYLRKLPADTLKIDQSFIRDMLTDTNDYAIVQGIIALAQTFQRVTVAEGVETAEHFAKLKVLGCDLAQGYGIAKPMSSGSFRQWLHQSGEKIDLNYPIDLS